MVNHRPRDNHYIPARESWEPTSRFLGDGAFEEAAHGVTPLTIAAALNEYCHIPAAEYAIVLLQHDGAIKLYTSDSLRSSVGRILNDAVVREFQNAVQHRGEQAIQVSNQSFSSYTGSATDTVARRHSNSTDSSVGQRNAYRVKQEGTESDEEEQTIVPKARKRNRGWNACTTVPESDTSITYTKQLVISETANVAAFYMQRFKDLQQFACKGVAKAFVKVLEPKKQTNYPYTGGLERAPYWWPQRSGRDMVRHKEPDHLLKHERVKLLVHILQLVVDQDSHKPPNIRAVNVKRLEEVTYEAMAQWFSEKESNMKKKAFLKEIFKVARQEERYRKGEIDPTCTITVMHGDDQPGAYVSDDDDPEEGIKYDEEELAAQNFAVSAEVQDLTASNPDNHFPRPESDLSGNFNYGRMQESSRSYLQPVQTPPEEQSFIENQSSSPTNYMARPSIAFQVQQHVVDANRRQWHNGFPSPPNHVFSSWGPSNGMHMPMQYHNLNSATNSHQNGPYLPPPTSAALPPLLNHQSFHDNHIPRAFESGHPQPSISVSRNNSHQLPHQHGYQDYLHDSNYPHSDEIKEHSMHSA